MRAPEDRGRHELGRVLAPGLRQRDPEHLVEHLALDLALVIGLEPGRDAAQDLLGGFPAQLPGELGELLHAQERDGQERVDRVADEVAFEAATVGLPGAFQGEMRAGERLHPRPGPVKVGPNRAFNRRE